MEFSTTVVETEPVGPDTVALTFASPAGFDARPGQFLKLSGTVEGEEYARFYTLSSPNADDTFEVTIEVSEEGGPFSEFLADLMPGDEVAAHGPFGTDFYEGESRAVVLAGGPGVGPAVAIAEAALDDGHDAAVVYRYDDAPAHADRLESLREDGADVAFLAGDEGLGPALTDLLTDRSDEQVFVYGFAGFVGDATAAIEAAGGDPDAAKVESFG